MQMLPQYVQEKLVGLSSYLTEERYRGDGPGEGIFELFSILLSAIIEQQQVCSILSPTML